MGLDIPNTLCPLCDEKEEDVKHLMFDCRVSSIFWSMFGNWWQKTLPAFNRCEDPKIWAFAAFNNTIDRSCFQVAANALMVSIWKLRNGVVFDKLKVEVDREFRNIKDLSFLWLNSRCSKFNRELINWTQCPYSHM